MCVCVCVLCHIILLLVLGMEWPMRTQQRTVRVGELYAVGTSPVVFP